MRFVLDCGFVCGPGPRISLSTLLRYRLRLLLVVGARRKVAVLTGFVWGLCCCFTWFAARESDNSSSTTSSHLGSCRANVLRSLLNFSPRSPTLAASLHRRRWSTVSWPYISSLKP